jgi:hypothetical protein
MNMKQLELFEISPEEKKFLEMIKTLEDKSDEIDILKHEVVCLRSHLEEAIRLIDKRFSPPDDSTIPYDEDHEYEYIQATQEEYLDERIIDFQNIERDRNTKIH